MDGVISLIKPPGITSHDAIGICRRILKERRIGHSGTLDPLAYGVLPIYVGKATRAIEYTESIGKTYVAECKLGIETDTEDSTGNVLRAMDISKAPSWDVLEQAVQSFQGSIEQRPSKYSAIKINGQRAYDLARAGVEFTLPSRLIHIYDIELLAYVFPFFTIRVRCSAGTYVRALLRNVCQRLDLCGMMTQLCRTGVGQCDIEQSVTIEELETLGEQAVQPVDTLLTHLPAVYINDINRTRLVQGKQVPVHTVKPNGTFYVSLDEIPIDTLVRAYDANGFMSILRRLDSTLKVEKNIYI
jgi:tRNA pseudouridine synthase B